MRRDIILHSHIFKNAGTTFDHVLERNFGDSFLDHRSDQEIIIGKQEYLDGYLLERPYLNAFSSHSVHFTASSNEYFHFIQVYFIRHPIERFRSVYNFEQKQSNNPENSSLGPQMAKKINFKEYISWRLTDAVPATIRNCQTVFLSGEGPGIENIKYKFKLAKENLKKNNFIGVVDRYDESMVVFEHYLRPIFPHIDLAYIIKNVTNPQQDATIEEKICEINFEIGNALHEESVIKNKFDMEIFKMANKKLDEAINKFPDFDKLLQDFNNRCVALNS